jgi:hypothetical protein
MSDRVRALHGARRAQKAVLWKGTVEDLSSRAARRKQASGHVHTQPDLMLLTGLDARRSRPDRNLLEADTSGRIASSARRNILSSL